jgi:hypothetical protein
MTQGKDWRSKKMSPRRLSRRKVIHYPIPPVTLVKENKKKKLTEVKEAPAVYANAVLTAASFDPDKWYANFTSITFLGRPVSPAIHVDLAVHLKNAEKKLAAQYGGPDKRWAWKKVSVAQERNPPLPPSPCIFLDSQ